MNKMLSGIKQVLLGLSVVVTVMMVSNLNLEEVQAAGTIFEKDSITVAVGDEVYLPYLVHSANGVQFYIDDTLTDPAAWFFSDDSASFQSYTLYAGYPGSITVYADDLNGNYDTMQLNVIDTPIIDANTTVSVGFQEGQICREFILMVPETATYNFLLQGDVFTDMWIYDEEYYVVKRATSHGASAGKKYSSMEVPLQEGMIYYVDLCMYQTSNSLNAPDSDIVFDFTVARPGPATGISLVPDGNFLKVVDEAYYILENEIVLLGVIWEGTFFSNESYEVGTTNSTIASVLGPLGEWRVIGCNTEGTVTVSATTTNMHQDSFTLVVVDKQNIVAGDVDFDGLVTKQDIIEVYSVINGIVSEQGIHSYADMNKDGVLDDEDIERMWQTVGCDLPFIDVTDIDWFYDAVEYNYNEKIMTGMNNIQFGPYESLSRAQFALILYRMQGTPEATIDNQFIDIVGDEWYADAVLWAYENGIVTGFGDETFRPADLITREQMVVMMYRYANYLGEDTSEKAEYDEFIDAGSVSEYASEAMQWAVGNGILTGKVSDEGSKLAPWGATARAEAAVIIQRYMNME